MRTFQRLLLIGALMLLSGCGDVGGAGGAANIRTFHTEDGTKCVYIVGAYKAGIACDFQNNTNNKDTPNEGKTCTQ
jgi:hypothetical protein